MINGKYEIIKKIGQGSFGQVFLGQVSGLSGLSGKDSGTYEKKKVIIKIENSNGLLKHETNVLYYLLRNHCTNIPVVHWYGNIMFSVPSKCLVMTYFPGKSLEQMRDEMTWENKKEWMCSTITLLEQIHKTGIIHRDIKPAHFILSDNGWNLIDFGFATFYSETRKSEMTGSPNYMSLYVQRGEPASRRDDLISLGYVFLELCIELPWKNKKMEKEWDDLYRYIDPMIERDIFLKYFKECESGFYENLRIICI